MPQRPDRSILRAFSLGAALALLGAAPALAETVTLSTLDGSFSVGGEIVDFDGTTYTLRTAVGEITVAANLVVCQGAACPAPEGDVTEVTVAGERTLGLRLVPAFLRAFAAANGGLVSTLEAGNDRVVLEATGSDTVGDLKVTILPTNSSTGIESLFKGQAQLALASRPARPREIGAFAEFGLGNLRDAGQEMVVGLDGLVLVTHPQNPVRTITVENAGRAFAGRIANWADLGGADAPINLYIRTDDDGAAEVFQSLLLDPGGLSLAEGVTVLGSDEAIVDAVLADPNGLGVTGFSGIGAAQPLAVGGSCGLYTQPTLFSIKTEEYPLTRMLYLYKSNAALPTEAEAFRAFMASEPAQAMVASAGFIDQSVTLETINAQGLRIATTVLSNEADDELPLLREMLGELVDADRLSTTFRFETGAPRLDARSQADVLRLASVLGTDRFASKEVLFVGFTDSVGDAEVNRELSRQRAEQVLRDVIAANPALASSVRLNALGYGEISPLGCNESTAGRLVNRRVEVWVRDIDRPDQG